MRQIPYSFECEPYGDFVVVTPLISKGRLRIYYKGENRNGGFITDEFSVKLEKSLPYTPVVGDYDEETGDFRSHNMDRNVAAIYGIVPENPNTSWEPHVDKDGVQRTYLCCDVYLYTGRYDAAKAIIGKSHSMELNRDSMRGDWERRGMHEVYVYRDAYFDGLCVLGDNVEPCFEGSGFFSHETGAIKILEDYVRSKTNILEDVGLGGKNMDEDKVLDFEEVMPEVEAEIEVETSNDFEEVEKPNSDEVDLVQEEEEDKEEETPTPDPDPDPVDDPTDDNGGDDSGNDGTDTEMALDEEEDEDKEKEEEDEEMESDSVSVVEDEKEEEDEKKRGCYVELEASFDDIMGLFPIVAEQFENLNNKILEFETTTATLETKVQELESSLAVYQEKEQEEINAQKESLLKEYSKYLDDEALNEISEKASDYSVESLEKELLFTAKKANPNFLKVQDGATFASLRTQGKEGIYRILENYKQKQKNS